MNGFDRGKVVQFKEPIWDCEVYAEPNMKARILDVYANDMRGDPIKEQVWVLKVKFDEFDEHNKKFEDHNYFNKQGVPCMSAREAGWHKPVDEIYLPNPVCWNQYLEIVDED